MVIGGNKTKQKGVKASDRSKRVASNAKGGSWQSCENAESAARDGRKVEEKERVDERWVTVDRPLGLTGVVEN